MLEKKLRILKWVAEEIKNNPTTRNNALRAWSRFIGWQLRRKFTHDKIVMPFLGDSRLVLPCHGEGGAWINAVTGLGEFTDLGFVLHGLRDTDSFIDAGANVGVYTVVAAGEIGARAYSFEPSPQQYAVLMENIRQNKMEVRVDARSMAVGECEKEVIITTGQGSLNHVVEQLPGGKAEDDGLARVQCVSLDSVIDMSGTEPMMVKIDVEGYEHNVLKGAQELFNARNVFAALVETHGYGEKYDGGSDGIDRWFSERGYLWCTYDPIIRKLVPVNAENANGMTNRLYVNDMDFVMDRVKNAQSFTVNAGRF